MAFRHPWRTYQRLALARIDRLDPADDRCSLGRPSDHAVPDLLGANRERADAFAAAWARHARSYAFDRWR